MKLLFFAQSADWAGRREMSVHVRGVSPLRDVLRGLPELAPVLARRRTLRVAVNLEYSDLDADVRDGDEVAFLPPVSGG